MQASYDKAIREASAILAQGVLIDSCSWFMQLIPVAREIPTLHWPGALVRRAWG